MRASDLGKVRGLQRVTSADGYFLICAIDHLSDFVELLPPGAAFDDVVAAKDRIVRAVSSTVSAVLLDPLYGLGLIRNAVPATVGVVCPIEDEDYRPPPGPRRTRLREGWTVEDIRRAGADLAKLLWYFRPDGDPDVAEQQRRLVRDLVERCAALGLPLVVEPIWYPLPGEDPASEQWRRERVAGIVTSAVEAQALGVDLLKLEFPGYVETAEGRRSAAAACAELDAEINVPWVILSAGVGYPQFRTQVEIACRAGASGYLAGRAIWREAVSTGDDRALAGAQQRFAELNAITRANARPYR